MISQDQLRPRFESLGTYFPERNVSTKELISQMDKEPLFDLERLTGIKNRRFRSENESSYTLALEAAKRCIENSRYKASELDVIIFCSITRFKEDLVYIFDPPMSLYLKKKPGAKSANNFDLSNACAGMMTGAYVLYNMIKAGEVKNGMVVSGECITPLSETAVKEIKKPIDPQFASLTVGDSGSAFIMDCSPNEEEGIDFVDFISAAKFAKLCIAKPSDQNPGAAMYTKARKIHKASLKRIPLLIFEIFRRHKKDFDPEDFDYIIPHQTSKRAIIDGIKEASEYFNRVMPEVLYSLQDYGNTSTTTHFVTLYKALKENKIEKGSKVLFVSLASGIEFGVLSATIGDLEA